MGPGGQGTPHVIDSKQSSGAAWHCVAAAHRRRASPAVRSTLRDLCDLVNLLSHMAGRIVDPRADDGDHGGMVGQEIGGTPVMTPAAQPKMRTSNNERWGT